MAQPGGVTGERPPGHHERAATLGPRAPILPGAHAGLGNSLEPNDSGAISPSGRQDLRRADDAGRRNRLRQLQPCGLLQFAAAPAGALANELGYISDGAITPPSVAF